MNMTDDEIIAYWKGAYERMAARSMEDGLRIKALEEENKRLRGKVPASALNYSQLCSEIAAVEDVIKEGFGEGGGSPGEWWYERSDELDIEKKRRDLRSALTALETKS